MTKKDYIKLAELINDQTAIPSQQFICKEAFINGLCSILKEDNPRFDRERFIAACK